MWYILIAVFIIIALFIGAKMSLSQDKDIDKNGD